MAVKALAHNYSQPEQYREVGNSLQATKKADKNQKFGRLFPCSATMTIKDETHKTTGSADPYEIPPARGTNEIPSTKSSLALNPAINGRWVMVSGNTKVGACCLRLNSAEHTNSIAKDDPSRMTTKFEMKMSLLCCIPIPVQGESTAVLISPTSYESTTKGREGATKAKGTLSNGGLKFVTEDDKMKSTVEYHGNRATTEYIMKDGSMTMNAEYEKLSF